MASSCLGMSVQSLIEVSVVFRDFLASPTPEEELTLFRISLDREFVLSAERALVQSLPGVLPLDLLPLSQEVDWLPSSKGDLTWLTSERKEYHTHITHFQE